jgi:hypothetical protein
LTRLTQITSETPTLPKAGKQEIFRRVADHLREVSAPRVRSLELSCDTEVYADLGLYGDDLNELIAWIFREFGVEPNINIAHFAPGEPFLFRFPATWKRQKSRGEYDSLKIRDIIAAIEAGQWLPPVGTAGSTPTKSG